MSAGKAYLVGAGPGSAGLITVRGRELLARAEVLVYDAPCDEALLAVVPVQAERIPVGRWPDAVKMGQAEIGALLVERVRAGKVVVRLKAGDPYMFGRGGDEALALAEAGLGFEVVPGVTCGLAAAAWAGIPITQRGISSEATFAVAHASPKSEEWGLDLDHLATSRATLVVHLDPAMIGPVAAELVKRGKDGSTPAAAVESAGCACERTYQGTLADLGEKARAARVPVVLLVGAAVALGSKLAWAERRLLSGRTVVLTRPRIQAAEMASLLEEHGAQVLEFPCIAIAPPDSFEALDRALAAPHGFDWLVLSSANGVEALLSRLWALGKDARMLAGMKIAAVGTATAQALAAARLKADLIPDEFNAEGLAQALSKHGVAGKRFLVVRAQEGREALPEELRAAGAQVEVCAAYKTVRPELDPKPMRERLERREVSAIAFASPSAVKNFAASFAAGEAVRLLDGVCVAAIGPVTAKAAAGRGIRVDVTPAQSTGPALVEALAAWLADWPESGRSAGGRQPRKDEGFP
ncbi:MAG: uroporphyrinogen-III C-methyltransferase [Myxococcales bacterium]